MLSRHVARPSIYPGDRRTSLSRHCDGRRLSPTRPSNPAPSRTDSVAKRSRVRLRTVSARSYWGPTVLCDQRFHSRHADGQMAIGYGKAGDVKNLLLAAADTTGTALRHQLAHSFCTLVGRPGRCCRNAGGAAACQHDVHPQCDLRRNESHQFCRVVTRNRSPVLFNRTAAGATLSNRTTDCSADGGLGCRSIGLRNRVHLEGTLWQCCANNVARQSDLFRDWLDARGHHHLEA